MDDHGVKVFPSAAVPPASTIETGMCKIICLHRSPNICLIDDIESVRHVHTRQSFRATSNRISSRGIDRNVDEVDLDTVTSRS